jgi:hypothetical protein
MHCQSRGHQLSFAMESSKGVPMPESRYHDEIPSNYVCSPIGDTLVLLFDVHAR